MKATKNNGVGRVRVLILVLILAASFSLFLFRFVLRPATSARWVGAMYFVLDCHFEEKLKVRTQEPKYYVYY